MKRFGPAMIDRRLKRLQTRHEVEREALLDAGADACTNCGAPTFRFGGFCSRECETERRVEDQGD